MELIYALLKSYHHLDERRKETNGLVEKLYLEIPENFNTAFWANTFILLSPKSIIDYQEF